MYLNQIKERFPKAYAAYLEMLAEDCADYFYVKDGVLCVVDAGPPSEDLETFQPGDRVMEWRPSEERKTMDVGAGWEERKGGLRRNEGPLKR